MTDQTTEFVRRVFGTDTSFYDVLGVDKGAGADEIKRAYRKLALVHHPDRSGGDTEKFKALSIVHSVLSDPGKRSLYDSTGEAGTDDTSEDFANWYDYFRTLFPKLTVAKIEEFSRSYKGSAEEKEDLTEAYGRFKGDMKKVMEVVMFAEEGEEERLCTAIDGLIAAGELASTKKYENFKKTVADTAAKGKKKTNQKRKKDEPSLDDLAAMIQANRQRTASSFGSMLAKYGGADGEEDLPDEAAFQTAQARLAGGSSSSKGGRKASRK